MGDVKHLFKTLVPFLIDNPGAPIPEFGSVVSVVGTYTVTPIIKKQE